MANANRFTRAAGLFGDVQCDTPEAGGLAVAETTLTATQVKALNATPITLVAAPGADRALIFEGAIWFLDYNSVAYADIHADDDLTIKYTNGSGLSVGEVEPTGWLDGTADAVRYMRPFSAASGNSSITPVANAALVAHMDNGEITTGNSPVKVRVYYRVVPTSF